MTEKRFECDKGSRIIIDNETKLHYIMTLDWECSLVTKLLNRFAEENEQLKQQNQEYKRILQDIGLLRSDEDVINICNEISDKILKPLFEENKFDVDINTDNGFTIIPKR